MKRMIGIHVPCYLKTKQKKNTPSSLKQTKNLKNLIGWCNQEKVSAECWTVILHSSVNKQQLNYGLYLQM